MKKLVFIVFLAVFFTVISCDDTDVIVNNNVSKEQTEMVWIKAGSFMMGSPSDEFGRKNEWYFVNNTSIQNVELQHKVTLTNGFFIGKYPVTQEQFEMVMGYNPTFLPHVGTKHPVDRVNWYETLVYCNKLSLLEGFNPAYEIQEIDGNDSSWTTDTVKWGDVPISVGSRKKWDNVRIVPNSNGYRLPTEAQWEYACRAGTTTAFYNGNNYNDVGNIAWYENNSNTPQEVGKKQPNSWGLYDMLGNIQEMCWDFADEYTADDKINPSGPIKEGVDYEGVNDKYPGSYRVMRGGCYGSNAEGIRSAFRDVMEHFMRFRWVGFRIVRP